MSDEAGAWMHRGIALLDRKTPESLAESLECFGRAIDLRRKLLAPGDHRAAYLLAANWMNRADALTRLGGPPHLVEALRSYDEALAVLREVSADANPLYRRRQAIAWINRGQTLLEQGTTRSITEAIESFEQGMAELRDHPEHNPFLACAWMNRGNALLRTRPVRAAEARDSANASLDLAKDIAAHDLVAAETCLKAQLVICQAVAELLAAGPGSEESLDLVCAATDAVEAGLRLARHWEEAGETSFGALHTGLFRFGIAVYRRHQPQFLTEFVLDDLHTSNELERHVSAAEALTAEARTLPQEGFASPNTPRFERLLETFRVLRLTEDRMRELSKKPDRDTF